MDTLLTSALAGTARQVNPACTTGTPIDPLIAAVLGETAERTHLLAAGALALYRLAGRQAEPAPTPPTPSPPDSLPVPSPRAIALLTELFHDRDSAVLPEALELLARSGRRLPPALLPSAFSIATPEVRAAVLPVLGERGVWLAQQNPAWHCVLGDLSQATDTVPGDAETIWQEGTLDRRRALLFAMRKTKPSQAREWLAAVWKQEKADIRHDLLGVLLTNLSPDDEPFLESTLDDRSENVRLGAARLLARIPHSALALRMRARAGSMLHYSAGTKPTLAATPPDTIGAGWQRDGIAIKPPATMTDQGIKGWWMIQTLALIAPAHWLQLFGATPAALVGAAGADAWHDQILEGWSRAAITYGDSTWALPLWEYWSQAATSAEGARYALCHEILDKLLTILPAAESEHLLRQQLRRSSTPETQPWTGLLTRLPRPWNPLFSETILHALAAYLQTPRLSSRHDFWLQNVRTIALSVSPARIAQAMDVFGMSFSLDGSGAAANTTQWRLHQLNEALSVGSTILHLRKRIYQELSQ